MMLLQIAVSVNTPSMLNVCERRVSVVESKGVLTKAFQHMGNKESEISFLS